MLFVLKNYFMILSNVKKKIIIITEIKNFFSSMGYLINNINTPINGQYSSLRIKHDFSY